MQNIIICTHEYTSARNSKLQLFHSSGVSPSFSSAIVLRSLEKRPFFESCDILWWEKSHRDLRFEIKPLLAHKLTFESRNKHHRLLAPCVLVTEHSRHSQQPRNIGFHHIVWSSKNRCSPRSSLLLYGCLKVLKWNSMKLLKALKRENPMASEKLDFTGKSSERIDIRGQIEYKIVQWCGVPVKCSFSEPYCLATALSTFWMMEMSKASWMASSKSFTGTSKKKANFFTWQNLSCWASVATLFHSFSFETTFPCHGTLLKRHRGEKQVLKDSSFTSTQPPCFLRCLKRQIPAAK